MEYPLDVDSMEHLGVAIRLCSWHELTIPGDHEPRPITEHPGGLRDPEVQCDRAERAKRVSDVDMVVALPILDPTRGGYQGPQCQVERAS